MSLLNLYRQEKSALAPPIVPDKYEEDIIATTSTETNNLVQKYEEADLFRPPVEPETYLEKLFAQGVVPRNF